MQCSAQVKVLSLFRFTLKVRLQCADMFNQTRAGGDPNSPTGNFCVCVA